MVLLRRRHEILHFNITELILSVMTELSNLLIGKTLKISIFHAPLPIFISSSSDILEGLISIAAPVECGMGRAVVSAAPWIRQCMVPAVFRGRGTPTMTWVFRGDMAHPEGGGVVRLRSVNSGGGTITSSEGGSMTVEGGTATSEGRNQNSAGRH